MHRYNYHRWVEMVDREIGTVLDCLENSRFRDNTWFIFTSDHGEGMSRHKVIGKILFYQEITEVPLVIGSLGNRLPVAKNTSEDRYFASGVDIAPTVCAIMSADATDYPRGRNLMPLVNAETPDNWRETAYVECAFNARMITDGHYKYIRDYQVPDEDFRSPGPDTHRIHLEQLFDLKSDPNESRNFAEDPTYGEVLDRMRALMDARERLLDRRPMPGEAGRNWLRQKLKLCKQEGLIA
jgi:arylsulfatase A-like enzyme